MRDKASPHHEGAVDTKDGTVNGVPLEIEMTQVMLRVGDTKDPQLRLGHVLGFNDGKFNRVAGEVKQTRRDSTPKVNSSSL